MDVVPDREIDVQELPHCCPGCGRVGVPLYDAPVEWLEHRVWGCCGAVEAVGPIRGLVLID